MNTQRDFDRIAEAWLADGPTELADRVLEDALDEVHRTHRRRPKRVSWRLQLMTIPQRLAAAAAVIVIALAAFAASGRMPATGAAPTGPITTGMPVPSVPVPPSAAVGPSATAASATPTASAAGQLAPLGAPGIGTIMFNRVDPATGNDATWLINPDGTGEQRLVPIGGAPSAISDGGELTGVTCCGLFLPEGTQVALGYEARDPARGRAPLIGTTILGLDGHARSSIPTVCGNCGSIAGVNLVPGAVSPDGGVIGVEMYSDTDPTQEGINLAGLDSNLTFASPPPYTNWQAQVTGAYPDVPVAFSPDASRLLFVRRSPDERSDRGILMLLDLASRKVTQVSPDGAMLSVSRYYGPSAGWSPDGSTIAFAATDATGSTGAMRIYIADPGRDVVTPITDPSSYVTAAAWSPDGSLIAYDQDNGGGRHDLMVIHPDGTGARNLTASFEPGVCCARWSPDGSALLAAATASANEASQLVIVPIDGSTIHQVTSAPAFYESYSWGPAAR